MYLKLQLKTIKLLPTGLPSLYLKPTSPQFFVKKEQLELATRCRLKGVVSRLLAASEVPSEADGGEPPVGCQPLGPAPPTLVSQWIFNNRSQGP